jgi:hypothetical protein
VAPVHAWAIQTEAPTAGTSMEPLYGRGEDNQARAVRWKVPRESEPAT